MPVSQSEWKPPHKLIIVGPSRSGKSMLEMRLTENDFHEPIICGLGIEFGVLRGKDGPVDFSIQVWEACTRFRPPVRSYMRHTGVLVFTFDLAKYANEPQQVIRELDEELAMLEEGHNVMAPDVVRIVVGCKSDLLQDAQPGCSWLTSENGRTVSEFCAARNIVHVLTVSAKTGEGAAELRELILQSFLEQRRTSGRSEEETRAFHLAAQHREPWISCAT